MKANARITGILFILGTATGIAAAVMNGSVNGGPDILTKIAANQSIVLAQAFLVVLMGLSCAGIGLSMYPVLKKHGEGLAFAAAGFRLMEGTIQAVSAILTATLLFLSLEFVKAGSPSDSFFQPLGAAIQGTADWVANGVYLLPWLIGATLYYSVFYRTRLVPRWLAVWGLGGVALCFLSSVAALLGIIEGGVSIVQGLFNLPVAVQEMVLAVWLIVKGWNEEQS